VSAAINASTQFPTIEVGHDLTLEAPPSIDVEIVIYGGLDPDTEELIANARKAAEILDREYGVYAIIVPRTLYWGFGIGSAIHYTPPILIINGKEVARGAILAPNEIVEEALALLGIREEEEPPLPAIHGRNNREAATATI
jgi:hypothetical protein